MIITIQRLMPRPAGNFLCFLIDIVNNTVIIDSNNPLADVFHHTQNDLLFIFNQVLRQAFYKIIAVSIDL